jgi:hypothetical protein
MTPFGRVGLSAELSGLFATPVDCIGQPPVSAFGYDDRKDLSADLNLNEADGKEQSCRHP